MSKRGQLFFLLRVFVLAALVTYLLANLEIKRLVEVFTDVQIKYVLFPPLLLFLAYVFAGLRWKRLLAEFGIQRKFTQLYNYYVSGAFYGSILPGAIGGDVVRAGLCSWDNRTIIGDIMTSVLVERVFGACVLMIFLLIAFVNFPLSQSMSFQGQPIVFIQYVSLLLFIPVALLLVILRVYLGNNEMPSVENKFIRKGLELISNVLKMRFSTCVILCAYTALFQLITIAADFLLVLILDISLSFYAFFLVTIVAFFATTLPISISGIGIRESVFVFFLSKFGVHSSDAIALALLIYCNRAVTAAIGTFIQLFFEKTIRYNGLKN